MYVEIKGAGNHNKGAEMMLLSAMQNIHCSDIRFVYAPTLCSDQYSFYAPYGLYPKASQTIRGIKLDVLARFIPKRIREAYGLVLDSEIEVIFDASGFAYSDQWGVAPARRMARDIKQWKRSGKTVILLPQAFGPFTSKEIRKYMSAIIECCDLIYARDEFSFRSLLELSNSKKIRKSPDFTVLFRGIVPDYFDKSLHQICIVPNKRVVDKCANSSGYLNLMASAISYIQNCGFSPYYLIHGGDEDYELAASINKLLDIPILIIVESNPYYIKGMIGSSLGLFGSRYHSIASALYSGVISIGIGWSHKYQYLFSDFGFAEGLIDLNIDPGLLKNKLSLMLNAHLRQSVSSVIQSHVANYKDLAQTMFDEINIYLNTR